MTDLNKNNTATVSDNTSQNSNPKFDLKYFPQSDLLANQLSEMFPEQVHEDKIVQRAREVLGENYSTEEIKSLIASYGYLINDWLEEYEREVFDSKTLKELLQSF